MLTPSGLSSALMSAIIAEIGAPADSTELQNFCNAVGNGVVPYLISNTVVQAGIAVQVNPTSGTGATTGTGTID